MDTGLKKDKAVERYAKKVHARFSGGRNPLGSTKQWATLTNQQRADKMLKYSNAELDKAGVPRMKSAALDMAAAQPTFEFPTWSVKLVGDLSRGDAPYLEWLVENMYHETRHCEQWFRMARKLAGDGQTAGQIATAMSIPNDIAVAAVKKPLKAQSEVSKFFHTKKHNARQTLKYQDADAWYQSVYGTGSGYRTGLLTTLPLNVPAYQALPEEVDAYIVGPKALTAYQAI